MCRRNEIGFYKSQKQTLNIYAVMGSLLLMLSNAGGTIAWINLYIAGRFTEWWVFALIAVTVLATLIFASKFVKNIRG